MRGRWDERPDGTHWAMLAIGIAAGIALGGIIMDMLGRGWWLAVTFAVLAVTLRILGDRTPM